LLEPTLITWILVIFGLLFIFLPMLFIQLLMVLRPHSQKIRDICIGKGEDWRDKTHFRMSFGAGWADLVIWLPLLAAGSIGVLHGPGLGLCIVGGIRSYFSVHQYYPVVL